MSGFKVISVDEFERAHPEANGAEAVVFEHADEVVAKIHAQQVLTNLERTQPSEHSGGQYPHGIQDRVFVERPDGSRYRVLPPALEPLIRHVSSCVKQDDFSWLVTYDCGHKVVMVAGLTLDGEYGFCSQCLTAFIGSHRGGVDE